MLVVVRGLKNLLRNLWETDNPAQDTEFCTGTRHAVHDATGFILPNGQSAFAINGAHARRPV